MASLSRKPVLITSIACVSILLILGITSLVLWTKGYFTFKDPCVEVKSFRIDDLDLTPSEDGNIVTNVLDSLFPGGGVGDLASSLLPSQVSMKISIVLEVNNTNVYDLDLEQGEEGVVTIPAEENNNAIEGDRVIGSLEIPSSTLKSRTRNEIPFVVETTFDVLSEDSRQLVTLLVSGNPVVFRITAGIKGSSWAPGLKANVGFNCLISKENLNLVELDSGTSLTCTESVRVGTRNLMNEDEEIETKDNEVNSACYV